MIEIRKVKIEDADNYLNMLIHLDNETKFMMFEPGERPTDINITKKIIENSIQGDNLVLVALHNEDIVGFLSAQRGGPNRIKHSAYIVTGIREKFRHQGIGSRFFKELDNWAIENNITRLELGVMTSNPIAKSLYDKNGFVVEGVKRKSMVVDGEYVDEIFMAKLIV